jgi:broad specificity phosphatase PhoE
MERHPLSVVFVSPLSRTIQTGLLAIPEGPPFIVEDDIRERIGTHPCDKRRSRAELRADFPNVDFSTLAAEEDDKWTPEREPWGDLIARSTRVLHKLAARPETHIGLVTHNDFLQALLLDNERLRLASSALRKKFGNAEHLALVLSWGPGAAELAAARAPVSAALSSVSTASTESA